MRALGVDTFVNADFIARGLTGRNTEAVAFEAGRIMLRRLRQLAAARDDFAFESTLASRSFAPFLGQLKREGYRVSIFYFSLTSATLAVRRVNFFVLYMPLADEWTVFDNSASGQSRLVATYSPVRTDVKEQRTWQRLQRLAAGPPNPA